MSAHTASREVPEPLQPDTITAKVIREELWRPAVRGNDWRVFVVVGREGSGKSLTCASILRSIDPQFGVESTHFDPVPFLQDIARETDRPGVAVMADESGVGFGNRTWHDREQVEANQALQTARDYNRVVGLTLPRLEELDIQLQGRVHAVLETTRKKDGQFVEVKWKRVDPSRTGEGKIYKKYPKILVNGKRQKVTRLKIGPPAEDFIDSYQKKKSNWKRELFDRVIDRYEEEIEDDTDSRQTPQDVVELILEDERLNEYTSSYNGREYVDDDLLYVDFDLTARQAKQAKKILERKVGMND